MTEGPYKLPPDWRWVRLGEIFELQQGASMSPKRRRGINPKPFLRTLNIRWGNVDLSNVDEMDFTEDEVNKNSLKEGDLLICEGGDVGRTALWQGEIKTCLYQNHIHRLRRRDDNVLPTFYAYWMRAAYQVFVTYTGQESRTAIPNLSGRRLKEFTAPLPPIDEQHRIVAKVEAMMERVREAKRLRTKTREDADLLMQSTLAEIFSRPGTDLPKTWQWVKLGEIFELQQGASMSPKRRRGFNPKPFLRTLNIRWGNVDLSHVDEMDFTEDEVKKLSLKEGDLLICEGGDVGRTALWQGEIETCLYQNHIHRLRRRDDNILPKFYAYWMRAAYQVFVAYAGQESRTAIPNLSGRRLKEFAAPFPPLDQQQHFVAHLDKVQKQVNTIKSGQRDTETELQRLEQSILDRAFRGEL